MQARQSSRVPDFFIVGHPKSGTTALYEMLSRHPQIFMPELKEPMFLASDMRDRQLSRRLPQDLDEYLALFAAAEADQRVGEASALYLMSRSAAPRIAELQPAARIIAILREPTSFLRSLHLQLLESHVESKRSLAAAISLEAARRDGRRIPRGSNRPQLLQYSSHVRYVEQLRRYQALFPSQQMLVLIYDDFRRDNEGTVRSVLRFLGVDEMATVDVVRANPTVGVRSQQLDKLVRTVSVGRGPLSRGVKRAVKAVLPSERRRELLRFAQQRLVHRDPGTADERLALQLRRNFRQEVVALSEYLDRDLVSLWGYDDVS
jgi:hypothetical protein